MRAAGIPPGTVIDVADLFYNLPARRKFLKADSSESAQISRLVTQFALGYPEVGFTFTSNGRKALQCPPANSARDRFFQIFGDRPDLVEVSRAVGPFRVFGFVARLTEEGPARGPQSLFVNRRIVRDRNIAARHRDGVQPARPSRSAAPRRTCSSRCRPTGST